MRAVLDTNVIVSATLIRGGNEDKILRAWLRGEFSLVVSRPIIDEYARTLAYERIRKMQWMSDQEVVQLLEGLAEASIVVPGRVRVRGASRDPDDDKFLEAAVALKAEVVISGDKALLRVGEYMGIRVLKPREFLQGFSKG